MHLRRKARYRVVAAALFVGANRRAWRLESRLRIRQGQRRGADQKAHSAHHPADDGQCQSHSQRQVSTAAARAERAARRAQSAQKTNTSMNFGNQQRRQPCAMCGGAGSHQEMGEESCHSCSGTGRNTHSTLWNQPCSACNGRGRKFYCRIVRCRACNGKGWQ